MNTTYLKIDMEDVTKHKIPKEIFGIGKAFLWGLPLISFIMCIVDNMGLWHFSKTPFYFCIIYPFRYANINNNYPLHLSCLQMGDEVEIKSKTK